MNISKIMKEFLPKHVGIPHMAKYAAIALVVVLAGSLAGCSMISKKNAEKNSAGQHVSDEEHTLYTCGMHPLVVQDKPGTCPICGMKLTPMKNNDSGAEANPEKSEGKGKILYWVAPMDPSYIRDEPGKSPMGMDLVPVYENDVSGGSLITIDPSVVQNMGVRTAVVKKGTISRNVRTSGHIDYDENRVAVVNSKISGWIEKLHVREVGAYVNKGDVLYEIYSPELVSAQQEYLLSMKSGSANIKSATRKRLEFWDIPESEIKNIEKSGVVSKSIAIKSPLSGYITNLYAVEGKFFTKGSDMMKIADLTHVWAYAHIFENEASLVKVGDPAIMNLSYLPGKKFEGVVDYVYPFLDTKTRDVQVRMSFPNPDLELKPQMYADVELSTSAINDTLLVPSESIMYSGEKRIAFVVRGEGKFQPREVVTGIEDGLGNIQILSGLAEDEYVVSSGQFLLDSESRLKEAIAKMISRDTKKIAPSASQDMPDNEEPMEMDKATFPDVTRGKYVCQMEGDDYYADEPGTCPKCGMDLVETEKLHEELHGATGHTNH